MKEIRVTEEIFQQVAKFSGNYQGFAHNVEELVSLIEKSLETATACKIMSAPFSHDQRRYFLSFLSVKGWSAKIAAEKLILTDGTIYIFDYFYINDLSVLRRRRAVSRK